MRKPSWAPARGENAATSRWGRAKVPPVQARNTSRRPGMHGTQFPTCTHLYGNLHYEAWSTKYFRVTWHALLFMEYGNRVSLVPLVSLEFPRSGANLNVKQLPLIQGGILARTTIAFQVTLNHRNHQNEPWILIKILSEISKPGCTSSEPSSLGPQTHRRAMCLKILRN